jgi:hypothetical protein
MIWLVTSDHTLPPEGYWDYDSLISDWFWALRGRVPHSILFPERKRPQCNGPIKSFSDCIQCSLI